MDTSSGAITGTPTTVTAQASYTVTASNSGGSTATTVSLVVTKAYVKVLELGHGSQITLMRSTSNRVLSQDYSGHWALWDSSTDSELASGDQYFPTISGNRTSWTVDMAGTTIAVGQPNGLEVRSAADGHLLSLIASQTVIDPVYYPGGNTWWKLASDGSYICAGSKTGLAVWSPDGHQVLFRQGDYSKANAFAGPGQVQVALEHERRSDDRSGPGVQHCGWDD